jgi:anti-sigma-K factor RskA
MSARDDRPLHPNLADALGADAEHADELDAIARRIVGLEQGDAVEPPPAGLWAAIDAEVTGTSSTEVVAPVTDLATRRPRRVAVMALSAAAAVLLVAAAAVLRDDGAAPTSEQVALAGLPEFADVTGSATVVIDGRDRSLEVDLSDVDVPRGSHLELWLLDEPVEQLVPLGPLDGAAPHAIPDDVDLSATPLVDVSLELDDGNPAHSGVSVARGRIQPI